MFDDSIAEIQIESGLQLSENIFFSFCNKDIIEPSNRQSLLTMRFESNKTCIWSIKKVEPQGNQIIHSDFVSLSQRQVLHLYKNLFCVAHKWELVGSNYKITMCSTFICECRYDNRINFVFPRERVLSEKNDFRENLRAQNTFRSLSESNYHGPQRASTC